MADMLSRLHVIDAQRARLHLVDKIIRPLANTTVYARVPIKDEQRHKLIEMKGAGHKGKRSRCTEVYPAHPTITVDDKKDKPQPQPEKRRRGRPPKNQNPLPTIPREEERKEKRQRIGMRTRAWDRDEKKNGSEKSEPALQDPVPTQVQEEEKLRPPPEPERKSERTEIEGEAKERKEEAEPVEKSIDAAAQRRGMLLTQEEEAVMAWDLPSRETWIQNLREDEEFGKLVA